MKSDLELQVARLKAASAIAKPAAFGKRPADTLTSLSAKKRRSEATNVGTTTPREGPKVVIFQESPRTDDAVNRKEKRSFMSAKVTDVIGVQKKKTAVTAEEEKQDREDDAHDKELMDLLKTSRLIEELTTAELSGKSRRKHLSWKLLELGAEPEKIRAPPPQLERLREAAKKRAEKRLQEAKENGMYSHSRKTRIMNGQYKEPLLERLRKKKEKEKAKQKANEMKELKCSVGKFENGVLRVPKRLVRSIAGSSNKARKVGKSAMSKSGMGGQGGMGKGPGKGTKGRSR